MPTEIVIKAGSMQLAGYFNDSPAGLALAAALPLEGQAHRWGDAVSFPVPVALELDDTRAGRGQGGGSGLQAQRQGFMYLFRSHANQRTRGDQDGQCSHAGGLDQRGPLLPG